MKQRHPLSLRPMLACALALALGPSACAGPPPPDAPSPPPAMTAAATPAVAVESQDGGVDAVLAALPQAPDSTPSPWVRFAVEQAMGAECEIFEQRRLGYTPPDMTAGHCRGPMPRHLAAAWKGIVPLLPGERGNTGNLIRSSVDYIAVPGRGRRPDFFVRLGSLAFRSFEGVTPAQTVYAVWGATCIGAEGRIPGCVDVDGRRVYRADSAGVWRDVTGEVMPPVPILSSQDLAMQTEHGGSELFEYLGKLSLAPVTQWVIEYDPDNPPPIAYPRLYDGWAFAHFGFVIWDGRRFELRERVPRGSWPCVPRPAGQAPCSGSYDQPDDPLIIDEKATGTAKD